MITVERDILEQIEENHQVLLQGSLKWVQPCTTSILTL